MVRKMLVLLMIELFLLLALHNVRKSSDGSNIVEYGNDLPVTTRGVTGSKNPALVHSWSFKVRV